jgi:hypothetical protein
VSRIVVICVYLAAQVRQHVRDSSYDKQHAEDRNRDALLVGHESDQDHHDAESKIQRAAQPTRLEALHRSVS